MEEVIAMDKSNDKKFLYWFFDLFPEIIFNKIVSYILSIVGNGLNDSYNKIKKDTNYDV